MRIFTAKMCITTLYYLDDNEEFFRRLNALQYSSKIKPKSKTRRRIPYGQRYHPKLKAKIKPGLTCPKCPILGCLWIYTPDGHIRCYGCGYPLPERYEEPL